MRPDGQAAEWDGDNMNLWRTRDVRGFTNLAGFGKAGK